MSKHTDTETTDTILVGATKETIDDFVDDVQSLWLQNQHRQQQQNQYDTTENNTAVTTTSNGTIPILEYQPTSMEFLRDYVSLSRPCIIRNVNMNKSNTTTTTSTTTMNETHHHHFQQQQQQKQPLLTLDELVQINPDLLITVDVTPDGYGDCIRKVRRRCRTPITDTQSDMIDYTTATTKSSSTNGSNKLDDPNIIDCFVRPLQQQMTIRTFQQRLIKQSKRQRRRQQQQDKQHEYENSKIWDSNNIMNSNNKINNNLDDVMNRTFDEYTAIEQNDNDRYRSIILENNNGNNDSYCNETGTAHDNNDNANDKDDDDGIVYYSQQNDCLRNEMKSIWDKIQFSSSIDFTKDVFVPTTTSSSSSIHDGDTTITNDATTSNIVEPTAINIWIGNECSTSYIHKDYYENLYYVCCGTKIITLCPPSDILFLKEQTYISGQFVHDTNNDHQWKVQLDYNTNCTTNTTCSMNEMNTVQWIGGDVLRKSNHLHQKQFPLLQYTNPITIQVQANEMIYIPSLWLHHVTQLQQSNDNDLSNNTNNNSNTETIAINYWYEMNFMSPLYTYFHLLQQMNSVQMQEKHS